jgi:hypothetical protein
MALMQIIQIEVGIQLDVGIQEKIRGRRKPASRKLAEGNFGLGNPAISR